MRPQLILPGLCPFTVPPGSSLVLFPWRQPQLGEVSWGNKGRRGGRRCPGQSLPALPSCPPSTHPLPGAFFGVSFPAINSGESVPGLSVARSRRKPALAEGSGQHSPHPRGEDWVGVSSHSHPLPTRDKHVDQQSRPPCCPLHHTHFNTAFQTASCHLLSADTLPPARRSPSLPEDALPPLHLSWEQGPQ